MTAPKPHIYYLANARLPTEKAHGYQISQMCQAFLENGASVEILAPTRVNAVGQGMSLRQYYGLRRDLFVKKIWSLDLISWVGTRWPRAVRLHTLLFLVQTMTYALGSVWFLRRHADILTSIIYTRDLIVARLLLLLLPTRLKSRVVIELHDLSRDPQRRARQYETLRQVAGVVTVTGAMAERVQGEGRVPLQRVLVAHDAVDLETFAIHIARDLARQRCGLPKSGRIAAFVGKFHTNNMEKGIPEILRAIPLVAAEFPDLHFWMIGGPLDRVPEYQAIIQEVGAPGDRIHFEDKRPVTDVPYLLAAADLLLMPHPKNEFYAYHVSPLKLFEYMSAGRPIIASKLPAIEEILSDGVNALLGEPGDPEAIAANIRRALTNPDLAQRIATKAQQDVQCHSWRSRAHAVLDHCQTLF